MFRQSACKIMNSKIKGVLLGAVAAATYGMNPLFALPLYREGMTADSVLFYRYALAIIMLGVIMKFRRLSFRLTAGEVMPLVCAGLLFAGSSLFLFLSYRHMDAGIASTLLFVYPVMVAVIMAIFFREKITLITAFSIGLALSGIALLYRGGDGKPLSLMGVSLVLISSLTYALYMVLVNRSTLKNTPGMKLTFYSLLFGLLIFLWRLDGGLSLQVIPSWTGWANILSLALLPTVLSLWCTALSIHLLGPTPTAILGALEPVTAVFFGVTVFGEALTVRLMAGMTLIIIAVMLIIAGKEIQEYIRNRRQFRSNTGR